MPIDPATSSSRRPPTVNPGRPPLQPLLAGPPMRPVVGTTDPNRSTKRIVVSLDADTFDRIAMLAAASRVTFAEAVRQLIVEGFHHFGESR